eukprot:scaffold238033_cov17-Prasinocladus_malaysianus.AAC.1
MDGSMWRPCLCSYSRLEPIDSLTRSLAPIRLSHLLPAVCGATAPSYVPFVGAREVINKRRP